MGASSVSLMSQLQILTLTFSLIKTTLFDNLLHDSEMNYLDPYFRNNNFSKDSNCSFDLNLIYQTFI